MNEEEYLGTRLDDQLAWYERKARTAQRRHKVLRAVEFMSAALVPVAVVLGASIYHRLAAAALGAIAAAAAGFQSVNHYQEAWVEYRAMAERLKSLRFAYVTHTAPFDGEDALQVLVDRVEQLLTAEHSSWGVRMSSERPSRKLPNYLG
jgi:hypothetical protein